jgi:hypothetical protein
VEGDAVPRFMRKNLGTVLESLFVGRGRFGWGGHVSSVVNAAYLFLTWNLMTDDEVQIVDLGHACGRMSSLCPLI